MVKKTRKMTYTPKFFAIAAIAMMALTANAQTWVGGEIGFTTTKEKGADKAENLFTIAPEIGYNLNEKWAVALSLEFSHNEYSYTTNSFEINPYVRYNAVKMGNFTVFVDGGIYYSSMHYNGEDDDTNTFGVGFNPGISYAINDKIGLVAHIGDLSYENYKRGDRKDNIFNFKLRNHILFGMYVNL